jgi:hypothetical protein
MLQQWLLSAQAFLLVQPLGLNMGCSSFTCMKFEGASFCRTFLQAMGAYHVMRYKVVLSIDNKLNDAVVPMTTLDLMTESGFEIWWDILSSKNLLAVH